MLRRYCLYGGIRRPLTQPHPSEQFGRGPTMTLSAAPPPPNRHPPFVDDIRGWDEFFSNSPRLTPLDRCYFGSFILVPPKSHEQKQPSLASTPEIFLPCARSPPFLASSGETLGTSLVFPTTTTNLHGRNVEASQPDHHQRNDARGERYIPLPATKEPPHTRGAGASYRTQSFAESRSKKGKRRRRGGSSPPRGRTATPISWPSAPITTNGQPPVSLSR